MRRSNRSVGWMKPTVLVLAVFAISMLAGCGESGELGSSSSNRFEYEYTFNGRTTGKHTFDSKEALCDALQDNELNRGFWVERRKAAYEVDWECPGEFTPR